MFVILYQFYSLKNIISIQKIVSIGKHEFDQSFIDYGEKHEFWEFVFVEKGRVLARSDEKTIPLQAGEIIFHEPNEYHSVKIISKKPATIFFVSFQCKSKIMTFFKKLKTSLSFESHNLLNLLVDQDLKTFEHRFNGEKPYLELSSFANIGAEQLLKNYLENFLISVLQNNSENEQMQLFSSQDDYYETIYTDILRYLNTNIYTDFSVDDLCRHMHYSKTFLSKIFKDFTKTSIKKYYNILKIEEAKKLLAETPYPISKISEMLHYTSQFYFSQQFKTLTNMNPSEYRQKNKGAVPMNGGK